MMRLFLLCALLTGCDTISSLSLNATGDPNNPDNIGIGGTITFRAPAQRKLPNYSKDK